MLAADGHRDTAAAQPSGAPMEGSMDRVGFVGLGIMGKPMAKNLVKAGYPLVVYDIVPAPVKELAAAGAKTASNPREVALASDVVITMLPNSPHVREVVLGKDGILEGARSGQLYIDMSSIDPMVAREVEAQARKKGVVMLDAPVSGGEPKAVDGTLAIMVGGPAEAFERARPMLLKMGATAVLVGDIGSGNVAKLANQIVVALNIAAMSEALVLATKAGVDPERVYQAIRGGLAGSTVLDAKAPMVLARNFKPGFRIELHIKDLANALSAAHAVGAPIPLTSQIMEIMQALKVEGREKEDHSSVVHFYEKLASIEVKKKS
jgi:2-hydroxy-3-oxopropionate reductase